MNLKEITKMGWTTNDLRIEMMNNKAAKNSAEAIKNFATANAANYDSMSIDTLMADLTIADNAVVLDCSYFMRGYDYTEFVPEICKMLAATESFKGKAYFIDGSSEECTFTFSCDNGTLNLRSVYYPIGYCPTLCCEECGEDIIPFDEYEEGKTYICPECGEEIDLAAAYEEYKPEIKEIVFNSK